MRPSVPSKELEKRRQRAVDAVIKDKMTVASVARRFQVNIRTVYTWLAAFKKSGAKGLRAKPAPGAPRKLKKGDLKLLEKKILKGARAAGFPNDLWTCARVAELIKREFGIDYHFNHVGKLLAQMGWSPQRPEKRAIERDDRRIRNWVKKDFPRIKKKREN
jgi:transposase